MLESQPKSNASGTDTYNAPEKINKQGHNFYSEVWGIGIIFYMLCQKEHQHTFVAYSKQEMKKRITDDNDYPKPLPSVYSDLLRDLI